MTLSPSGGKAASKKNARVVKRRDELHNSHLIKKAALFSKKSVISRILQYKRLAYKGALAKVAREQESKNKQLANLINLCTVSFLNLVKMH